MTFCRVPGCPHQAHERGLCHGHTHRTYEVRPPLVCQCASPVPVPGALGFIECGNCNRLILEGEAAS